MGSWVSITSTLRASQLKQRLYLLVDAQKQHIVDKDDWYSTPADPAMAPIPMGAIENLAQASHNFSVEVLPGSSGSSTAAVLDSYKACTFISTHSIADTID